MKRYLTGLLALIICLTSVLFAVSCSGGTLYTVSPTDEQKKVVGYMGEFEVYYDEIYYLTMNYKNQYELKYGEGIWDDIAKAQFYMEDLQNDIIEALAVNYSALALAKQYGITVDSAEVVKYRDARMEEMAEEIKQVLIASYKGDDEAYSPNQNEINDEYVLQLKDAYMTDRYLRFLYSVDGCVEQLVSKYKDNGKISDDDAAVEDYIYNNFCRTLHIYIRNDTGESAIENRAKAQQILDRIDSGKNTFIEMMERSEDFKTASTSGYYFCRGEMTDVYESAAYALDINEYSGIIEDGSGFYIIKRLPIETNYVNSNFEQLKQQYHYGVVNDDITNAAKELKFEFTEFGKTLSLWALK